MASDMKIWIKGRDSKEFETILEEISSLGFIEEKFSDRSCNFEPYDNECCDEIIDVLDNSDIDYEMV